MEQNKDISMENGKSSLTLENRKKMTLNGVSEIISFNEYYSLQFLGIWIFVVKT